MSVKLHLVGVSPDPAWRPPAVDALVARADLLAGGRRLLELFPDFKGRRLPLTTPLSAWLAELNRATEEATAVVLASGDPNFFGLARQLLAVIPPEKVAVTPSPTTVQAAFARLKTTWHGAEVVSLHGRDGWPEFWAALFRAAHHGSGFVAVYTDAHRTPAVIARRLLDKGLNYFRLHVFENLAEDDERVGAYSLAEGAAREFSPLNLAVLECRQKPRPILLGQEEEAYVHEAGLITKAEVRAVALSRLELRPRQVLWDLGAGSGSVSIEAAALLSRGAVWAVEKSPDRVRQIFENRAAFGAAQVEIVSGRALEVLPNLPDPDRIFLGGGGAGLAGLITAARARLKPGGVIVVSLVSLTSLTEARAALTAGGTGPEITQVQAARSAALADGVYLKPLNPVWLLKGKF